MKILIIIFTAFAFLLISGNNCSQKSGVLFESSFEQNGNESFGQWETNNKQAFNLVKDAPKEGGEYSLKAETVWGPPPRISVKIKIPEGTNVYKLSFWGKYQNVKGKAWIGTDPDSAFMNYTALVNDTSWNQYTQVDTITTGKDQYLYIILSGGFSELLSGATYFDLIKLEVE